MRFLADESCDVAVVRVLRAAGHDVSTVADREPGADDERVIRLALEEGRVLLTEDRDFGRLAFASSGNSPGIVYIRFPATARSAMAAAVLRLAQRADVSLARRFVVVQPGRIRISARMTGA